MAHGHTHGHSHAHGHAHGGVETTGRLIQWAHNYDRLVKFLTLGKEGALRKATLDLAWVVPDEAVLDVGCGTGTLTLLAAARVGEIGKVCGIDASPQMIDAAQAKAHEAGAKVEFRNAAIEALPYGDGTFDVVLSSLMFHHLPENVKAQGLAELYRVLKPGGRLVIVDMKRPAGLRRFVDLVALFHAWLRTGIEDIAPMMKAAGFVGVDMGNTPMPSVGYLRGKQG